jgi:hypothetical protein
VTPLKFLIVPGVLALLVVAVKVSLMFRARAMRTLAARLSFQYIGPTAFRWGFPSLPKVTPPFPASFSLDRYPANGIRQVWNVIEGQQSGVSVLIFDGFLGIGKGRGTYCTFIACETERNLFGEDTWSGRVVQPGKWKVYYRVPTFQILPWTMGIKRINEHLDKLRIGSRS